MTNPNDLLPCPFCGCTTINLCKAPNSGLPYHECEFCGAEGPAEAPLFDPPQGWNIRALLAEPGETKTTGYSAEKKALALFLAPELDALDSDWSWEDDGLFQTALNRLQYFVDDADNLRRRLGEVNPTAFNITAGETK